MVEPAAEGWFGDPYGLHEDRWFSEGDPTKLVRDGGVESYDDPPAGPRPGPPAPLPEEEGSPGDLRRADDGGGQPSAAERAEDVWASFAPRQ